MSSIKLWKITSLGSIDFMASAEGATAMADHPQDIDIVDVPTEPYALAQFLTELATEASGL